MSRSNHAQDRRTLRLRRSLINIERPNFRSYLERGQQVLACWLLVRVSLLFCGGLLPDGSNPIWYPRLTEEERARLQQRVAGITTAEEAIQRLGPPDYDVFMNHWDSVDGELVYNEKVSKQTRNVECYNLSEHANVEFYFQVDKGTVDVRIDVKSISPRHIISE